METQTLTPKKSLVERYLNKDQTNQPAYSLIEWPKSISRKRVFNNAWTLPYGYGKCSFYRFKGDLKHA